MTDHDSRFYDALPTYVATDPRGAPPRPSTVRRLAVAIAAVASVGVASVAISALDAAGGAETPEAAVEAFFEAVAAEDVIGVLESVAPGERDAARNVVEDVVEQMQRLGLASEDADLSDVGGFDFALDGALTFETTVLLDGVTSVTFGGASLRTSALAADAPMGESLRRLLGEYGVTLPQTAVEDVGPLTGVLVAVEDGGDWYVSLGYSIAESMRQDMGAPPLDPALRIAPEGAETPEAAVRAVLDRIAAFDLRGLLTMLPPGEAGALQDYAQLFLPAAQATLDEARADFGGTLTVESFDAETDNVDGGHRVRPSALAVHWLGDGIDVVVRVGDGCITAEGLIGETDASAVIDELGGTDGRLCADVASGGELERLFSGGSGAGLVVVEEGGRYYLSPVRTVGDGLVSVLSGFTPESIRDRASLEATFAPLLDLVAGVTDAGS